MAVIALTSASGSPGVTTTTLGLAVGWPRPVLVVEADPTGGSAILAGYLRGHTEAGPDLVDLAFSPTGLAGALPDVVRPLPGTPASYVQGTRTHQQAGALRDHWAGLGMVLAQLEETGQDVLIDAGRLGLVGSPEPLLATADITLLVVRCDLPAISAARSWAETVTEPGRGWRRAGLVLIGEGRPYSRREVSRVLGLPVVADIPDDPVAAAVFHRGGSRPKHFDSGAYVRSLGAATESLHAEIARSRDELAKETGR